VHVKKLNDRKYVPHLMKL